jgi:hypothetical protein
VFKSTQTGFSEKVIIFFENFPYYNSDIIKPNPIATSIGCPDMLPDTSTMATEFYNRWAYFLASLIMSFIYASRDLINSFLSSFITSDIFSSSIYLF